MACTWSKARRVIYLSGDVTTQMAIGFRKALNRLGTASNQKPITVEIFSEGGDMDAGFAIVDSIRSSACEIRTVGIGSVMSAATLILAAGDYRITTRNTCIMVHLGKFEVNGNRHELTRAEIPMIERTEKAYSRAFEEFTKKPVDYWDDKWKLSNVYLTAEEAKSEGVVDEILEWIPRS